MKKEKWLLEELEKWEAEEIITAQTAQVIKEKYAQKQNANTLIILFSIIGAILIGTGIILIGAKNWYTLPIYMRAVISILPLVIAQILSVYVIKNRYESVAWRESVAIFMTATVFSAIAMIGQTFHIAGDYANYLLTCGLLCMPILFILDAASPLLVYFYAILNWAAYNTEPIYAPAFLILLFIGIFFVYKNRKNNSAKQIYMVCLCIIAGFAATWILAAMLKGSILLALLSYFILLYTISDQQEEMELPYKMISITGGLVILTVLTYQFAWKYQEGIETIWYAVMISLLLLYSIWLSIKQYLKKDMLTFGLLLLLFGLCVVRFIWEFVDLDNSFYELLFMIYSNICMGLIGVSFIVRGTKNTNLITTNIGLVSVCLLIVLRFFDTDMDFLWRGISFLGLGILFLLVNLRILKYRKRLKQEVRE